MPTKCHAASPGTNEGGALKKSECDVGEAPVRARDMPSVQTTVKAPVFTSCELRALSPSLTILKAKRHSSSCTFTVPAESVKANLNTVMSLCKRAADAFRLAIDLMVRPSDEYYFTVTAPIGDAGCDEDILTAIGLYCLSRLLGRSSSQLPAMVTNYPKAITDIVKEIFDAHVGDYCHPVVMVAMMNAYCGLKAVSRVRLGMAGNKPYYWINGSLDMGFFDKLKRLSRGDLTSVGKKKLKLIKLGNKAHARGDKALVDIMDGRLEALEATGTTTPTGVDRDDEIDILAKRWAEKPEGPYLWLHSFFNSETRSTRNFRAQTLRLLAILADAEDDLDDWRSRFMNGSDEEKSNVRREMCQACRLDHITPYDAEDALALTGTFDVGVYVEEMSGFIDDMKVPFESILQALHDAEKEKAS